MTQRDERRRSEQAALIIPERLQCNDLSLWERHPKVPVVAIYRLADTREVRIVAPPVTIT